MSWWFWLMVGLGFRDPEEIVEELIDNGHWEDCDGPDL